MPIDKFEKVTRAIIAMLFLVFAAQIAGRLTYEFVFRRFFTEDAGIKNLLSALAVTAVFILRHRNAKPPWGGAPLVELQSFSRIDLRWAVALPAGMMVLFYIIAIALYLSIGPFGENFPKSDPDTLSFLLAACVVAPIGEELAFRGYLLARLRQAGVSPITNITLCALLFGSIHYDPGIGIIGTLWPTITGFVSGIIMVRTAKLSNCMLAHATNNVMNYLVALVVSLIFGEDF